MSNNSLQRTESNSDSNPMYSRFPRSIFLSATKFHRGIIYSTSIITVPCCIPFFICIPLLHNFKIKLKQNYNVAIT